MQRAKSEWYQNKSELIEAQNAYRASMATLSLLSGQKIDELNIREVQVPKKSVDWVLDEKQQRYFVEAKNSSLVSGFTTLYHPVKGCNMKHIYCRFE